MRAEPACDDLRSAEECRTVGTGAEALHVHLTGDGMPVLYLHGFPEYFGIWRPLLARLGFAHRAILVDLPGFNRSAAMQDAEASAIARRLARMLDTLGIARFGVVAHDIGGLIAWQLASDLGDRVSGLFLLSSPHPADFIRHFWQDRPWTRLAYLDQIAEGGFDFDPVRLAGLVFPDDLQERALLEVALRRSDGEGVGALYRVNVGPRWLDRWSDLPPVDCPTKALSGRADRFLPPALFEDLARHVAAPCEVALLDQGEHFLQITRTTSVAAHLGGWLATSTTSERRPDDAL